MLPEQKVSKRLKVLTLTLILVIAGLIIYHEMMGLTWPFKNYDSLYRNRVQEPIVTFDDCTAAGNPIMESFPEQCRTKDGVHFVNWRATDQICIQIIAEARNPNTGETRTFPTPCDVPEGWEQL